ncbi:ABC transporter ATP-binding protein [Clostridium botulinum]|uniref:ABC transporter, ATP-binding protein n=1 Tax=Clostridium botulinum D str. 1873 TaxID=592027 RepID=A0A9P2G5N5_CLOBO|nr:MULTISPECIES: ABC transporter ATP-binding protein [Clostridium]EES90439.1 ABC transporter, ATP-binding protein [Clostridium botulinum D str. 1873]MBO3442743.1 ABC transporter ATP-binding protein [Clostridium haemolyticum]NFV48325.1 ABC transporter ATP-binding protein [Clostridium botulinum]QPW55064.1 ABC transporter ATP-binding protein [Clostridium botulinum]
MIEISNLSKTLGDKNILKDISFNVKKGSIFGLIGPNGAGKTTLIKHLVGIYNKDKGSIKIKGENVYENPTTKKIVGYVTDENNLINNFNLKTISKFYKLAYENFDINKFYELNKIFQLPEKKSIKKFSNGMKMRVSIMLNLSINPEVLILDEPTNGLDPIVKKKFFNILLEDVAERGTTVIISSHNLTELERICDSIAIINGGEIKYLNSVEDMKETIRKIQVVFKEEAPKDLSQWNDVMNVEKIGRVYNIVTNNYGKEFLDKLNSCGIMFQEEIDLSLEDMFIYSVGGDVNYEELF